MKRQSMESEKMFANHISDKGLISKIDKKHTTQYWKQKQTPRFSTWDVSETSVA